MNHGLSLLKESRCGLETHVDNLLASINDLLDLGLRETLDNDEMLLWCECYCFNGMESSFFKLLDVSCVNSFLLESLDGSWAIDFKFLGLLFFFSFGFSWLFGLSLEAPFYGDC